MQGGGGSPEQSQRVVFESQLDENYSQTSARQAKRRFRLQARALAFTMFGRLSRSTESRAIKGLWAYGRRIAFTMAEILLSLTIIGVVAAITLPSLTGNINERTWNTQRKALYARFSQAIALMPSLNGYGTLREITDSAGSTSIEDTAAETFVTSGLSKVLKINNICDNKHLSDCGVPAEVTALDGDKISFPAQLSDLNPALTSVSDTGATWNFQHSAINSRPAAFETQNGESIAVFYNPYCTSMLDEAFNIYMQQKFCANLIFDLNGNKGPNTIGKDMGIMTIFYPSDSVVVMPVPHLQDASKSMVLDSEVSGVCVAQDSEYRLPSIEEISSISINKALMGELSKVRYWSTTFNSSGKRMYLNSQVMLTCYDPGSGKNKAFVRCVKRN